MKRWISREYDPRIAERIQNETGLPALLCVLLAQRGVAGPLEAHNFLNPKLSGLHDPYLLLGMRLAVERVQAAIARREKILVYGDYDVDGSVSVVLLLKALELAGGVADYHVPHRVREGYGMREEVVERAAKEHVTLLVSVDTGIRDAAVVERASELGIDCIITDHHLPEEGDLPRALAVLNPNQPGCAYPDKGLCGAGVAFKLAQALLMTLDWPAAKLEAMLRSMLKIVAIATIADLVPLRGENRVIARLGLDGLRRRSNPGLEALLEVSGLAGKESITAGDVAFRVAPRINAAGRMDTARAVIELFSAPDIETARPIAGKLDGFNADRQQTESDVVDAIVDRLAGIPPPDVAPFIVIEGEGWHPGVIGIVASRIVDRFHRPTLVLSVDPETGLATGSARSIPGFHLLESLESVADIFERFGGHKQAAGCTVKASRIETLRRALNDYAVNALGPDDFLPLLQIDAELAFPEINDELMGRISRLAPHGIGNPPPLFWTRGASLAAQPRILKEKHLRLQLAQQDCSFTAMGWRMAEIEPTLRMGAMLDAAYSIETDDYFGGWRLNLRDLRAAQPVE